MVESSIQSWGWWCVSLPVSFSLFNALSNSVDFHGVVVVVVAPTSVTSHRISQLIRRSKTTTKKERKIEKYVDNRYSHDTNASPCVQTCPTNPTRERDTKPDMYTRRSDPAWIFPPSVLSVFGFSLFVFKPKKRRKGWKHQQKRSGGRIKKTHGSLIALLSPSFFFYGSSQIFDPFLSIVFRVHHHPLSALLFVCRWPIIKCTNTQETIYTHTYSTPLV